MAKRMYARRERRCAKYGLNGEPGEPASELAVCMDVAAQDVSLFGERDGARCFAFVGLESAARPPIALQRLTRIDHECVA